MSPPGRLTDAASPLVAQALSLRAGGSAHGRRLFEGLAMSVEAGQCWAVLGPNGAGKSTLLAALAGLLPAAAGTLTLGGRALSTWTPSALAAQRAWCPQFWVDPFPSTVDETVRLARLPAGGWRLRDGDGDDGPALQALLQRLDLQPLARHDVRRLSGGERQRVAIACALWQGAPHVLLDEPAAHLDPAHQQQLVATLRDHAAQGGAVVATVHDLNLAWSLATHAVLIDGRGGVVAGPRAEVLTPPLLHGAFGVPVDQVEVCGVRRFWIGPLDGEGGP